VGRSVIARPRASFHVPGRAEAGADSRMRATEQAVMAFSSDGFSE